MEKKIFRKILSKLREYGRSVATKISVRAATHHVFGPRTITLAKDEVALICMLKNGSYYVAELIKHHKSIGIDNFLFIDNGSEDDTIERISKFDNVTVVSNKLPVKKYEIALRSQIARRIIKGGWFLFVDTDEIVEFINGNDRSIKEFADYCNQHGYEVVVGQCLDLFSTLPMKETVNWDYRQSIKEFDHFSLSEIENFDYHDNVVEFSWFLRNNDISNPNIKLKFGGIRKELFNENCALSVHRMVRNLTHTKSYTHPHCSSDTTCADFTLLIRHYKFAGPYLFREKRQIDENVWEHAEDKYRLSVIKDLSFTFSGMKVQKFSTLKNLVNQRFLDCSDQYLKCFPFVDT